MCDQLFEQNARVMEQMNSDAASMVSAIITCCEHQNTKILLIEPPLDDGFSVRYEVVAGVDGQVRACGVACGAEEVSGGKIKTIAI